MNKLEDKEIKNRISDLLYIQKEITVRIHTEIDEVMRGHARSNEEIKESIIYMLDDRLR